MAASERRMAARGGGGLRRRAKRRGRVGEREIANERESEGDRVARWCCVAAPPPRTKSRW